jgi:hypothetical protein
MNKRPLSLVVIGLLYLATGVIGLAHHLNESRPWQLFQSDIVWISLVELIAIVAGVYLLLGSNWARWLALAWIAFHVILSAFHSWFELVVHALLCAAIAYLLFRPSANQYFRSRRTQTT